MRLEDAIAKEVCWKFLNKKHRPIAEMKTPYWKETRTRPNDHAIIPYEIYGHRKHPNEHETVRALKALCEEGKAYRLFRQGYFWICKK